MEAPRPAEPARSLPTTGVEPAFFAQHNGSRYRTPLDLQTTPDSPLRFLVVGGCLAEAFPQVAPLINSAFQGDFILVNNFDAFPNLPSLKAADYDFQIAHIPLRTILGNAFFHLPDDGSRHEEFFRQTQDYLSRYLSNVLRLNAEHKLLTFVLGFLVPQQNPLGRFQPRFDLRNIVHFIERLNMFLAAEVAKHENAYFVDTDQISSSVGKKSCQDDAVWSFTHGTTLSDGDHDHDLNRIEPPPPMQQHYSERWLEFFEAVLQELFAMYRTLRQQDAVKLVAVDLDDTLWRGVAAEGSLGILEGWPMGFIEALLLLKKRGILLAIVSKNDEPFIVSNWNRIVHGQIALADFAARRINFRSKVDNLADILREMNLRPQNTVMIDDNPVERAAIQAGLPGVRGAGPPSLLPETHSTLVLGNPAQRNYAGSEPKNRNDAGTNRTRIGPQADVARRIPWLAGPPRLVFRDQKHHRPADEPGARTLQQDQPVQHHGRPLFARTMSRPFFGRTPALRAGSRGSFHPVRPRRRGMGA